MLPALQGRGLGGSLLDYAEAKADIAELTIVSCRTSLVQSRSEMRSEAEKL